MSAFSEALGVTASALKAQADRLRIVSENIANADTPGYRRKTVPFEAHATDGGIDSVAIGDIRLSDVALDRVYDPAHPLADETGHYEGSNVDMIIEIADAREAQRSYEANLKMFEQTRQMSSGLMELLRR